jgi:hypothetical protein
VGDPEIQARIHQLFGAYIDKHPALSVRALAECYGVGYEMARLNVRRMKKKAKEVIGCRCGDADTDPSPGAIPTTPSQAASPRERVTPRRLRTC